MKRKNIVFGGVAIALAGMIMFISHWASTQPIWIVDTKIDQDATTDLPDKNKAIVAYLEANGKQIAPNYKDVVCTEFVIKVIDHFTPLTKTEMNDIRIITNDDLRELIDANAPVIKGVQTALTHRDKGIKIESGEDARPGDFVQFWNIYNGKEYGHCGIVMAISPNKTLTVYSSHPSTQGYGKQCFLWPDKLFFARLH
ncbi:hypothetical protein SAMN04488109_3240 [Chryseolinea serpens]|uniref:CHAP domain-containing protein n=1 Tax=Chryseolinea serpens TaxID=947013 RepID=A0A1M5R7L2_9BACT|nr:hypothetical protein [Chryseolinea serpens]SHH22355.1 hypothetical protein SAMN04488109_3240 [Chryseolinea serpens]